MSTDSTTTVDHASQHANINDAMEAVQARLGVTGSAVATSLTKRLAVLEAAFATQGAWSSWTPAYVQPSAVTSSSEAYYCRIGRLIVASAYSNITGTGTVSNNITCSIPVTARYATNTMVVGSFHGNDTGNKFYAGTAVLASATGIVFVEDAQTAYLGNLPAWTLTNTDTFSFTIMYEAST